jgi:hypothetical protein
MQMRVHNEIIQAVIFHKIPYFRFICPIPFRIKTQLIKISNCIEILMRDIWTRRLSKQKCTTKNKQNTKV